MPRLYHQFARSAEIDEATYFAFETLIAGPTCPPLQPHEDSLITRSLQYNSDFSNFKRVPGTILDTVAYYQLIGADNDAWGKAVGTIDTGASRALAWFFCLETPGRKEMYIEEDGTGLLRRTVDLDNSRSTVSFSMSRFGLGVADRVFVSWFGMLLRKLLLSKRALPQNTRHKTHMRARNKPTYTLGHTVCVALFTPPSLLFTPCLRIHSVAEGTGRVDYSRVRSRRGTPRS